MEKQTGFTLLELMVIIAIAAALLTIGIPSFQQLMSSNRITSQLNLFSSTLALARSEAVKRNELVVICASTDGATCDVTQDFTVGWLTFIDRTDTTPPVVLPGGGDPCAPGSVNDCILNYVAGLSGPNLSLRTDLASSAVVYTGLGSTRTGASSFVICDEGKAASAKAVTISTTGRASVRTTKPDGSALSCTP